MTDLNYDLSSLQSLCKRCENISHPTLSKDKPIVIFGAGSFGKDFLRIFSSSEFKVIAFVESHPKSQLVQDIPVYQLSETPKDLLNAQLVVGIFNRSVSYKEIEQLLLFSGFKSIFFPWQIYDKFSTELGWRYWLSGPKIFSENQTQIEEAFSKLADEQSREIFIRIIKFRAGQDLNFSEFKSSETQYFNDLTLSSDMEEGINFVDCGAYNGDTLSDLVSAHKIKSAYLFEPDPDNFKKLVSRASGLKIPVICLPLAVSDRHEVLSFSGEIGESGTLSANGNLTVSTVALDDLFQFHSINFLKFDVEGGECAALIGAKSLIKHNKPVLAISLYHKPTDLWHIPLLINRISSSYKLYIRQHWLNTFDSVLYAVHT